MAEDFESFVAVRAPRLHRTAFLLTKDWSLAEDLLQATLTRVWQRWNRIDDDADGYVYKAMVNTYNTWWRRKWRGEIATADLPDEPDEHADDSSTSASVDLWAAVNQLPRRQRIAIVLRYFVDLTEQQTAEAMGCSVGTVKSSTSKALVKLRIDPNLANEEHAERSLT